MAVPLRFKKIWQISHYKLSFICLTNFNLTVKVCLNLHKWTGWYYNYARAQFLAVSITSFTHYQDLQTPQLLIQSLSTSAKFSIFLEFEIIWSSCVPQCVDNCISDFHLLNLKVVTFSLFFPHHVGCYHKYCLMSLFIPNVHL